MTTISELQRIVNATRSLLDRWMKESYLLSLDRDILNFLGANIYKNGIAKKTAEMIPISVKSKSSMEDIVSVFNDASLVSRKKDKVKLMNTIQLTSDDREFVLTCLFGSLKLGLKIPLPLPIFGEVIKPMLCSTKYKFDPLERLEEKFNGIRCITMNINDKIQTYTRNGKILDISNDMKNYFKQAIPPGCIVDGEIIDLTGDFFSLKRKEKIIYQIFDIIFINQESIINQPLKDRLDILNKTITENEHVILSKELQLNSLNEINEWIISNNAEGIISKNLNDKYIYGSRKSWKKFKHFQDITCHIVGFTQGEGKYNRNDMIGAIKVIPEGYDKITNVGSGFTDQERIEMRTLLDKDKNIKVDIKYQEVTPDGALQFPIFLRIREINSFIYVCSCGLTLLEKDYNNYNRIFCPNCYTPLDHWEKKILEK